MIEVCQRDAGDPPWFLEAVPRAWGNPTAGIKRPPQVAMIWTNPPKIGALLAQKLNRWLPLLRTVPGARICVLIGPDEWPLQQLEWPPELVLWRDRTHIEPGAERRLIQADVIAYTEPGELVVDPFLGFGTTGAVAKVTGRSFYGCDINAACVLRSAALLG